MTKYLDYPGLSYFWNKIKSWVRNYTHASYDQTTGRTTVVVDNITFDVSHKLPADYAPSTLENDALNPAANDSYDLAFSKIHKAMKDTERVTAEALTNLDSRIPTKTSQITNDSGYITIDDVPEAEVNQNAFSNIKVGNTTIAADAKTDTLELVAGTNITLTPDATNDKVTIATTAEENTIQTIKVNNTTLTPDSNRTVNIDTEKDFVVWTFNWHGSSQWDTGTYKYSDIATIIDSGKILLIKVVKSSDGGSDNHTEFIYVDLDEYTGPMQSDIIDISSQNYYIASQVGSNPLIMFITEYSSVVTKFYTLEEGSNDSISVESRTLENIPSLSFGSGENNTITINYNGNELATKADIPDGIEAITGAASTIISDNLTANRALISNGSGKIAVSAVTSTELGYLDGVTSNVQTQLNNKADKSTAVTNVAYDSTNKKITKTINGTTSDVVTVATLKSAMSLGAAADKSVDTTIAAGSNSTNLPTTAAVATALGNYIPTSAKGTANGVASLDENGKVPIGQLQLPSYVDDVIEVYKSNATTSDLSSTYFSLTSGGDPIVPEAGKIYVLMQNIMQGNDILHSVNSQYRYSGSSYVQLFDGGVSSITTDEIDVIAV